MKTSILAAAFGLLASAAAFATETAAPSAPAPAPKPDKAAMAARSQECAKEEDVQGLKGHSRKVFHEKCKRGLK